MLKHEQKCLHCQYLYENPVAVEVIQCLENDDRHPHKCRLANLVISMFSKKTLSQKVTKRTI